MASLSSGSTEFAPPVSKRRRVDTSSVNVSPSTERSCTANATFDYWDAAVKSELKRYAETEDGVAYRPGPMNEDQLLKAAQEFVKRCDETEDSETVPWVLVSRNCKDMPSRRFELAALQSSDIRKLWYVLTKNKDLLIIKASSDDVHSKCVASLVGDFQIFSRQYGARRHQIFDVDSDGKNSLFFGVTIAPDAVLQRRNPPQPAPPQLRAPLVAELEYGNRGPKALMEQLSTYLTQPDSDYVLGIKIYKRTGPPVPVGKRPFPAIALLWRRGGAAVGQQAQLVDVWSFGTCPLNTKSKTAFCKRRGTLEQIRMNQIVHPAPTDMIVVPAAHLVQGAVDMNGNPVATLPNGRNLEIDLERILGVCDATLDP